MQFPLKKLIHTGNDLVKKFLNFLFPDSCISCGLQDIALCKRCLESIPRSKSFCKNNLSVFAYQNPVVKKALWNLKYRNRQKLAKILAQVLHDYFLEELSEKLIFDGARQIVVIPVPSSNRRMREREFNSSEILAKEFANLLGVKSCKSELKKIRETKRQVETKNREERLQNLKDAFYCRNSSKIKGKLVILVDDIKTTGATLGECGKAILENNNCEIFSVTIAS